MLKENEFKRLFPKGTKLPQVDTIRDTLKVIDINGLKQINQHIVKKAIENKVFENGTMDGYTVAAIDGTKFFESNKKNCLECLSNKQHYFHSGVVMSTIGDGSKLVIDFEMYRPGKDSDSKDEGEQTAAKRLVSRVFNRNKNFIDIVVYDALVCNSVWINHCTSHGVEVIVQAKSNKNNGLRQVKKNVNKQEPVQCWIDEKGFEKVKVYESTFIMENVEHPLRFM